MKSIQIINTTGKNKYKTENMTISKMSEPRSLDEFDINIIDFSEQELWRNQYKTRTAVESINDLKSLRQMIINCLKTELLFVLPQNVEYYYNYSVYTHKYQNCYKLKDMIPEMKEILGNCIHIIPSLDLSYEITKTSINGLQLTASFYFSVKSGIILSDKSQKPLLINNEACLFTTIGLYNEKSIISILDAAGLLKEKEDVPDWFSGIVMFDDAEQNNTITKCLEIITENNEQINEAKRILDKNNRFKSIIYSSGEELVEVVFEILEELFDVSLDSFIDEKKEDFRFKYLDKIVIGEIKGINSNVKSANVSQLEVHVQDYLDSNPDIDENSIIALLIVNHQRERAPDEREPINEKQIQLAKRNRSLIVETRTLLELFSSVRSHRIQKDKAVKSLSSQIGLYVLDKK